jgi:hypothetical protein
MAKKSYYEKLRDPRWQKKRLEVMEFNEFSCEVCGDNSTTLNVHHKEYFKDQEPWEYAVRQLACICENCHEETHDQLDLLKWVCSYALLDGPGNRTELAYLLAGYIGIPYEGVLSVSCMNDNRTLRNPYKAGVQAQEISSDGVMADYLKEKDSE